MLWRVSATGATTAIGAESGEELGWGLLDDAAVLGYVFSQLHVEIEAFKVWQGQDKVAGNAAE